MAVLANKLSAISFDSNLVKAALFRRASSFTASIVFSTVKLGAVPLGRKGRRRAEPCRCSWWRLGSFSQRCFQDLVADTRPDEMVQHLGEDLAHLRFQVGIGQWRAGHVTPNAMIGNSVAHLLLEGTILYVMTLSATVGEQRVVIPLETVGVVAGRA